MQFRLGAKERMLNSKLRDLLIMPVQRLPRYVMLLHELNSKTKADHPDAKDLANAEAQMKVNDLSSSFFFFIEIKNNRIIYLFIN